MTLSVASKSEGEKKSATATSGNKAKVEENQSKKIVIRRLPPTLSKEQFLDIVSPLPEYDFFYYCDADTSLDPNAYCRAYICFPNFQDVLNFKDRFDNYVFVDAKSNEYPALVEFAPFQRRYNLKELETQKKDTKCNTIEQDADYIKYLETFDSATGASTAELPTCESILEELEQKEREKMAVGLSGKEAAFTAPKISTPLLEFMKKKRDEKKTVYSNKERGDQRSNRRRGDRDRDDEKRGGGGGGGGGGNKRRDDHYPPTPSKKDNDSNKPESKSSNKQQSGKNTDSSSKASSSHHHHHNQQKQSNKSSSHHGSNNPPSNKSSSSNKPQQNTASSQAASAASNSKDDKPTTSKDHQKEKDQQRLDKEKTKNKDRPSIAIYNPAQRATQRQQHQKPPAQNNS